jgi:hypothetical protein
MLELDNYDRVVSQIYEAALVPAHWDIALTSMIDFFAPREWHVAFVVWERLDPPAGRFIGSTGVHPLARDAYCSILRAGTNGRYAATTCGWAMSCSAIS